jgi:chromosome segregation ATPase
MTRPTPAPLARRAVVLTMTIGVLAIGVATVQTAAQWRAASAPLDTAPVSMEVIEADAAAEAERAAILTGQIDEVSTQVTDLAAALVAASDSVAGDTASAEVLRERLDATKQKLERLQDQLGSARKRLAALNAAAERQAALNRAARAAAAGAPGGGGGGGSGEDEHEDEDDEDEHDDD